ncbi:MAG: hypothetical protein ABSG88_16915 [Bradyrhizobium sp.]
MKKFALLTCVTFAAAMSFANGAAAKHLHHHHWHQLIRPVPQQSLTMVGTPDCHVQGRLFRATHHCPPEAVAAAPR